MITDFALLIEANTGIRFWQESAEAKESDKSVRPAVIPLAKKQPYDSHRNRGGQPGSDYVDAREGAAQISTHAWKPISEVKEWNTLL